jgi:hypothetical protein
LFLTWTSLIINSLWFFIMTLSIWNAVYSTVHDTISLASTSLPRDPLAEVRIAIRQRNASRFALSKKSHAIRTGQSQLLEVKNDSAIFPFGGDERFQLGNVLFVDPAA